MQAAFAIFAPPLGNLAIKCDSNATVKGINVTNIIAS